METIKGIVRNISIVVLLASFMELLLPNSSMRRFIQLVMGLFVLMAILSPVTALLDKSLTFEIPAWSESNTAPEDQELLQVFEQGKNLRAKNEAAALEEYKKAVERQAKALALTVRGVEEATVSISAKNTGEIEEIQIEVGEQKQGIEPIKPITGTEQQGERAAVNSEQARIARELKSRLGALLGIEEEKVLVRFGAKSN